MDDMKRDVSDDTRRDENNLRPSPDSVEALRIKAAENLERIGFVGIQDILEAFKDKNEKGQFTSVAELKINYWDPANESITWSRSKAITMAPEIKMEKAGGYTTLILQFPSKDEPDLTRIWSVLSEYGQTLTELSEEMPEIPVLDITAVPMSLGGKFGLVATDPVFWTLQPSMPFQTDCTQIRILFQPESVLFLRDDSFETDEIIAKVKSELASEKLAEEAAIRKQMQEAEFKKQHEKDIASYLENSRVSQHTFSASKKTDGKKEQE